MAVQIALIDDWQTVASRVVDWSALEHIGEVSFLHDYPADSATLQKRLAAFEVICVMRERTLFDQALLRGLPNLKLLSCMARPWAFSAWAVSVNVSRSSVRYSACG